MIPEGMLQTGDGEKDHTQNLTLYIPDEVNAFISRS